MSKATSKKSGKTFALKKILIHNDKEGIPITALREIKILKSLKHENIVPLTEMAFEHGIYQLRLQLLQVIAIHVEEAQYIWSFHFLTMT